MYAVIRSGGKQERVAEGQHVRLELLAEPVGTEVALEPVLLVDDGGTVRATPESLAGVTVKGRIVGEELGPKINAMTYKPKTNQRRRWGHRQRYSTVEIVSRVFSLSWAWIQDASARASKGANALMFIEGAPASQHKAVQSAVEYSAGRSLSRGKGRNPLLAGG